MAEQGGPIGALLSSSFWQPFKNLTFGVYLVHIMVVYRNATPATPSST